MNPEAAEKLAGCAEGVAAVIVAHPDDEILWAGGTILLHPRWHWTVATLCRRSDPDRAPKFARVMDAVGAAGRMYNLDDEPDQRPLEPGAVARAVETLLPAGALDVVLTHSPWGEYTRHRRHEETSLAVLGLWEAGRLRAGQLWMFAYRDDGGRQLPHPRPDAHLPVPLPEPVWQRKRRIIIDLYGFPPDTFEARAASPAEAFWCFDKPSDARQWIRAQEGGT